MLLTLSLDCPHLSIIFRGLKAAILSQHFAEIAATESAVSFDPLSHSARQPVERDSE
jgi:hypothetical protein